jgi:methionyl-tRNA formyltransferase
MKKKSTTIVFFGSGPVAAQSLELLLSWCEVEAVVTKPQPEHHREVFPVLNIAKKYELPILTAANRKELDEVISKSKFKSRVGALIDYGIIVSQKVIDAFELGIVNSHFSILPELRGADPISFSILNGNEKTGVSLMLLVQAMDEGPLLAYGEYDLDPEITTPELTEDLIDLSNALLENTIPRYIAGSLKPQPQSITGREVSYTRKLNKADGEIDWNKSAIQIEREIRAYADWPKSRTKLGDIDVVITKAHVASGNDPEKYPGDFEILKDEGLLIIESENGKLCVDKLKPASKGEMITKSFIAGYGKRLQDQ